MADFGSQVNGRVIAGAMFWGIAGIAAAPAAAGPHAVDACPNARVTVAGAAPAERDAVCAAAVRAIYRLARCGVAQIRPVRVEIAEIVRSPLGTPIFGRFDLGHDIVFLTGFAKMDALVEDTPYMTLSRDDFHASLVVHEVVHAVMHQNYRRQPASRAAYEYPAYAIQLDSIAEESRARFLLAKAANAADAGLLFNDIVLGLDPFFFAARAYQHFASSFRSCGYLHDLLNGEVDFIVTLP